MIHQPGTVNKKSQHQSSIRTVNPSTGKVEKTYKEMSDSQVDLIFNQAGDAFGSWSRASFSERGKLLRKVAALMRERKADLARLCSVEMGKMHKEAVSEIESCINTFDYYAANGEQFLKTERVETDKGEAFTSYEPTGVIFSIQPWNYPFSQMVRSAAPNIMAGNTVVMKQASNVPQCAEMLERLFDEAGAPEGVYTNLFVSGSRAGEAIAHPAITGVAFTGSEGAGSSIAAMAGKHLKKTVLELGGSDACVVLDDVDLDKTVKMVAMKRLSNAGQICVSPKRIIVAASLFDRFVTKARAIYSKIKIGDPQDPATQLPPLVSAAARDRVVRQVEETVKAGATLVFGGNKIACDGAFMQPTILIDLKPGMPAYSEEVFGPVLCIIPARDDDEAVRIANDTRYGLGGSVIGKNVDRALSVARRIRTGMVFINSLTKSSPDLPFGGTKKSGYGREYSIAGIREFVNHKLIFLPKY